MDIKLSFEQVFPAGCYLAAVKPRYKFVDNKKTDELEGYSYVVANRRGFDKVTIKTPQKVPAITSAELLEADHDILVSAKGFVGRFYSVKEKSGISAIAEEVILE